MHIIIDGYNLIRQSPHFSELDLQDIALGRDALITALVAYKRIKRHPITVVFDGTHAVAQDRRRDRVGGIDIRFSRSGETADTVIKQMAAREQQGALVVSSDRDVADFSASRGCTTLDSPEFEMRLLLSKATSVPEDGDNDLDGWKPTTRKRGPRRRLSKKARKRRRSVSKL